jgi:ATP-dependent DNA helicase RecQ
LAETEVTEQLIGLSRRQVLQFIPRKFIPYVTFLQRRVSCEEIVLPRAGYADRKLELENRIQTMIAYISTYECRSRFLVSYFGETKARDCGRCDNCLEPSSDEVIPVEEAERLRQRIHAAVREQHIQSATQLHFPDVPDRIVVQVLHRMMEEEDITFPS